MKRITCLPVLACDNPIIINSSSGTWYNSGYNHRGMLPESTHCFLRVAFPELQYDSFLTIGSDDPMTPHPPRLGMFGHRFLRGIRGFARCQGDDTFRKNVTVATMPVVPLGSQPFPRPHEPTHISAFAGDDLKILVMQITTAGTLVRSDVHAGFQEGLQSRLRIQRRHRIQFLSIGRLH